MASLPKTGTSLSGTFLPETFLPEAFLPGTRSSSGLPAICRRISLVPFLHVQGLSSQTLHYASLRSTSLRFAAICNQLHFASLRCNLQSTAINSASLRSAAIYNQLRPTPPRSAQLRCNLQPTAANSAPLRRDHLRFTSLHKSAATQGPATSRLSGSHL